MPKFLVFHPLDWEDLIEEGCAPNEKWYTRLMVEAANSDEAILARADKYPGYDGCAAEIICFELASGEIETISAAAKLRLAKLVLERKKAELAEKAEQARKRDLEQLAKLKKKLKITD